MKCKIPGYEDREACEVCKDPVGFCKHSVQPELQDLFPPNSYDLYILRRLNAKLQLSYQDLRYGITRLNIENNFLHNEIGTLKEENNILKQKIKTNKRLRVGDENG